ncbi:F-box domain-containing protein [Apiospora phragmitis]|uniref:F-box domain-containing protein n=1 Tax=Apiospora phragmitis TaxID=2905665 RepID=A0ABR1TS45_9PEZI
MNSAAFGSPEPQVAKQVHSEMDNMATSSEPSKSQIIVHEQPIPSIARLLKEKKPEWEAVQTKKRPLYLLDLPVDILGLIVKEITHTNDLTSLALTCSTLYNLSVPHIYARFDIVWPDSTMPSSESKGVDALTYGLSTLCLGSKFAQRSRWTKARKLDTMGTSQRLIDNQYAKYTRKFSLGNGPKDWVAEYNITKESGKMLGTLVALAVNKMANLETFVWDMPTGVLSDVFMALASTQDYEPDGKHKLQKVWIRWHDNMAITGANSPLSTPPAPPVAPMAIPTVPALSPVSAMTAMPSAGRSPRYADSHVEYPTFSVLPSLKSLTVLDIDELAYLDEMSELIERSQSTLRELRVGISQKALGQDFANIWEGDNLHQVDFNARWPGESAIPEKRLGGVLGVLVGRIFEIRRKGVPRSKQRVTQEETLAAAPNTATDGGAVQDPTQQDKQSALPRRPLDPNSGHGDTIPNNSHEGRKRLDGKLTLETLELERVSLAMQVCCKAFDWSLLKNLTVLDCNQHETLWKMLKRRFQPTQVLPGSPPGTPLQYHMALKRIHTDLASPALIKFVKETLAPNSLEVFFLQDRRRSTTPPRVTVEQVFNGALKRHRGSLKKLLLDSSDKLGTESKGTRWRHWVLPGDIVTYITSGRMPNLKELAVAINYRDWHRFLQRLPNIPQLRSLYIQHMQDPFDGGFEPRELALQLVDIVTLRPEVQLCYIGIAGKCFEILEASRSTSSTHQGSHAHGPHQHHNHNTAGNITAADVDEEDEDEHSDGDTEDENDDGDDAGGGGGNVITDAVTDDEDGDDSSDDSVDEGADSDTDSMFQEPGQGQSHLRLREILFYDDKVAIFKARHVRL